VLLIALAGCDDERARTLPDREFQQIYGDILFLGELYREDSTALAQALDSLLTANAMDTTVLFAAARETARDPQRGTELYRIVVERFERQVGRPDTTTDKRGPPLGFD
jgi:hypothetical protein